MSILDDETLKGVGRFAIEFNTLDELISALATVVLECAELDTAQHLTANFTVRRKLELIEVVCKILASTYALTQPHGALSKQISSAKRLIDNRNTVVHGSLTIKRRERPIVQSKEQRVELSPDKLSEMVREIDRVTDGLATAYYDFMDAVYKAREAASEDKTAR